MKYPTWVADPNLDEHARQDRKRRFLLHTAAAHFSPGGTLSALSRGIGMNSRAVNVALERGAVSPGMAALIESAVGADVCPKEELCPRLG